MSEYIVLKQIRLGPGHKPTWKTKHQFADVQLPPASTLRIVQLPGEEGFYLLYYDAADNEMTDTFHDTLQGALEQAEFEYSVRPDEWQTLHHNN